MALEEDEQRVKNEKERAQLIERTSAAQTGDLKELREERVVLKKENQVFFKDNSEMKEQLRVLNENLKRTTEVL